MTIRSLLMVLALTLNVGCASMSSMQTADTLGKGRVQGAVEVGVQGLTASANGSSAGIFYPHIDGAVRFGVSDSIDLGLRAGFSFLELQGKFLLTTPGDPNLAISVAPSIGGIFLGGGTSGPTSSVALLNIALPVLIGFKFNGGHELVLGPRLQDWLVFAGGAGAGNLFGAGASVGFAWRLTDGFALMPELSAVLPFLGSAVAGTSSGTGVTSGIAIYQFKLGFLIGRGRQLKSAEDTEAMPQPMQRPVQPLPASAPSDPTLSPPPPPPVGTP
jgi:hypothetical protein